MVRAWTAGVLLAGLMGCTSMVRQFVPGEPVTAERCQKMDVQQLGFKDGERGQRQGDKFEFWMKDCRGVGATLDRGLYNQGYADGLKIYCSCEQGFVAGVHDEFTEMRGQYYTCTKPEYAVFLKGHAAGKKYVQDPTLTKKEGPFKTTYFDELILIKAKDECAVGSATISDPIVQKKA